jgi:HD-GYP domain-containing protein (c-di-GMP phosphodiesterase class II)
MGNLPLPSSRGECVPMPDPMAARSNEVTLGTNVGSTLALGANADEAVGEHRASKVERMGFRERLGAFVVGGGFLVAAAIVVSLGAARPVPGLLVVVAYIGVYALVSQVEFEVFTGASTPTQIVLVPMLFVLPLRAVPFAVAAGLLVGGLSNSARSGAAIERASLSLVSAWHAIGPVVILSVAGQHLLRWSAWLVYLLALLAQFAFESTAITLFEWISRRTRPGALLPHLCRTQIVDAALAPVGLVFAFAAQDRPYAVLLALPLVGLLRTFASERRARIDNALELTAAYRGTAFLLGDVVEADDSYTGLHSRDVVELSVAVADELRISEDERREVEFVALLHDVGKIKMPSEIINKPGKLTAEERAVIETHTLEGETMLAQVGGLLGNVGRVVRSCHERWDGQGYPDGLAGESIPRVARIVMCCDAYSAMTTDRPYRQALPLETAINELRANAGTQFDTEVVDALIAVTERNPT